MLAVFGIMAAVVVAVLVLSVSLVLSIVAIGNRAPRQRGPVADQLDRAPRQRGPVADQLDRAPAAPAAPAPCVYGPDCPRCTGVGTHGMTAMDWPPEPAAAPRLAPVERIPARRHARRPRRVA